jgi:L-ascorbate metabolism protein UlaG (beta-lactamase superfamily)
VAHVSQNLRISRVLHAGYLFESLLNGQQTQILFDPIFENPFSVNGHAYPDVRFDLPAIEKLSLSAIFISHYHDDHCSFESLKHLNKHTPVFLYCVHQDLFALLQQVGFHDVRALRLDQTEIVGPFHITPRRALDETTDTLFEILTPDCKILNVVDAQLTEQTLQQLKTRAPWDLVLWPFQVMRESEVLAPTRAGVPPQAADELLKTFPEEWAAQLQALQPRAVVPSSCQFIHEEWSWYRTHFFKCSYKNFQKFLAQLLPETKYLRLNPGAALLWEDQQFRPAESLPWIKPLGPQDVDYVFQPNAPVLPTSEIAQKFPALSQEQKNRVEEFCRTEILNRYLHIGPPEDIYFQKQRLWRLSIFDHSGKPAHFFYNLCDEHMTLANKHYVTDFAWTTEISAYKLFSALENGESLSSLYLRINAETLSAKIERELQDVNHLEDPLLRTLYNGDALSYQRAQLRRLR